MVREFIGPDRRYHVRGWVKCTAAALAAVLAAVTIGVVPKAPKKVEATDAKAEVRSVNLGTLGLKDPDVPADASAEWSGSYVYFGTYDGRPVKYRVLDADTQDYNAEGDADSHTMLLDSDKLLYKSVYIDSSVDRESLKNESGGVDPCLIWQASKIRAELNSSQTGIYDYTKAGFFGTAFTKEEQEAVASSYRNAQLWRYQSNYRDFPKLTGEKVFILDGSELNYEAYGYYKTTTAPYFSKTKDKRAVAESGSYSDYTWHTRSTANDQVKIVAEDGRMASWMSLSATLGISPALNINLSKVAFTGVANADKSRDFSVTAEVPYNEEWRLTLKDSEGFRAEVKDNAGVAKAGVSGGDVIAVTVTDVPKMLSGADYGQLSAMLVDTVGTVVAYGKVADSAQPGELAVTLPEGIKAGNYTLKVFAETVNSAADKNLTDYASDMADIPVTITAGIRQVEVTGVTAPKAGVELDKSAVCSTEGIVTTTLSWKKDEAEAFGIADFQSIYTACATLTASEGYVFADDVTATINGNAAAVTKNADGTLTVSYTFPETAEGKSVRNIGLGTNGINNPEIPPDDQTAWAGSYVYFGIYKEVPIKFRVLDTDTQDYNADGDTNRHTMLLDSDMILFKMTYHDESFDTTTIQNAFGEVDSNQFWQTSRVRANLNSLCAGSYNYTGGGFLNTAFTGAEQNAIAQSYKQRPLATDGKMDYADRYFTKLTGEKVFLLSRVELQNRSYGYNSTLEGKEGKGVGYQKVLRDQPNNKAIWHTRITQNGMVSIVNRDGSLHSYMFPYADNGISPALNLDRSAIMFVAAANEGKSDTFAATRVLSDCSEWKLTVKDSTGFAAQIQDDTQDSANSNAVTVTVTNVPKMSSGIDYGQLSAMLIDETGTVAAYGKVADSAQPGEVVITLPDGIKAGNYTLKVFAERVNSAADQNLTDYASDTADIPVTVIQGITNVDITQIDAPETGAELDQNAVCGSSGIASNVLGWKLEDAPAQGVAAAEKRYTACVTLTASEGYAFADDVTATINGNAAAVTKNADGTLTVTYTFPETAAEQGEAKITVEQVEFDPVYAGYLVRPLGKALVITNTGNQDVVIEQFALDNTQDFALIEDEKLSVPTGETLTTWMIRPNMGLGVGEHTGKVVITYNEGKKAEAAVKLEVKVNEIEAVDVTGIEIPIGGRELDAEAVCETEGIKNTQPEIVWKESKGTVRAAGYNTSYTAYVTLTAKEGYVFAEQVTARMNYMPATSVTKNADGTLTVAYTFPATGKKVMDRPQISIDYRNELLTGFAKHGSYTIDGQAAAEGESLPIAAEWFENKITIVRKAETDAFEDSRGYVLAIPKRPDAPQVAGVAESVRGARDGSITGTDSDMEYRLKLPGEVWKTCAGGVKNLSPAFYEVRYRATDTSFAGKAATVEVKEGEQRGTLTVVNGSGSGSYVAGSKVTVEAQAAPQGQKFQCWILVSGEVTFADSRSAKTTVTVSGKEAEIRAVYEEEETKAPENPKPSEENTQPPTGSAENKAPTTGDTTGAGWLMLLMLLSGAAITAAGWHYVKKRVKPL